MKRFKYMALAALVAFAACDEGTDVVITPDVTGDIAGVVTIEGAAVTGVTVALSSGATTTTGAGGSYSFSGVAAGAYTITISGFAADATFSSTSKAATIVTTGQVATVNFDGAYVRTSAILGSVAAGGKNLPGVTVTLGSSSTQTDANGNYSFSGLRAGTYTLTVSGFNASQYAFATSTQNVTVGVGESKVVSFGGQLLATSTISGTLYIDGNGNLTMDSGEPAVAKAGIQVALERAVGDTLYTGGLTDANGKYAFTNLEEGTYKVILLTQAAFPGAFTRTSEERYLAVATSGATTTVNFAFAVTTQYVKVYGMLGRDAKNVGVAPIKSWTVNLYPTDVDATAATFPLVTANSIKTDAAGLATFKFLRTADYSPNASKVDGIVFAKVAAPTAGHTVSGETVIEIPWSPMDSIVWAPDTFDAVFNSLVVKMHAKEIDNDTLIGWRMQVRAGKDSTSAVAATIFTNPDGDAYFNIPGALATYPDTFWFRLPASQLGADGGHGWNQTPNAVAGTAMGSFLRVIWDGTIGAADTVVAGYDAVKYTDTDVTFRVHRELDDTLGYTAGDAVNIGGPGADVSLYSVAASGTKTLIGTVTAVNGVGTALFPAVDVSKNYYVKAKVNGGGYDMLADTGFSITFDGSDQAYTDTKLKGSAGGSSFMVKANNGTMQGWVASRYGASNVAGLIVTIAPTAGNIQGTATKLDTTNAAGLYSVAGLREGPYTVTVAAGDSAYTFLRTLKKTVSPVASLINSDGVAATTNNDSPTQGTRDSQGVLAVSTVNFEAYRNDTKFEGLVVNDRDLDLSTIDPGEALAGAIINLYRDDDTGATAGTDTLTATTTTDANGAYTFAGLVEGRYTARWAAGSPSTDVQVTRGSTAAGVATTKISGTPVMGTDVTHTSANLPRWNYNLNTTLVDGNDADFTFLYANTQVKGIIKSAIVNAPYAIGDAITGMTVTLRRCHAATTTVLTAFSGPIAAAAGDLCTAYYPGQINVTTDATGTFTFANLVEGIYEVVPNASTVAGFAGIVAPNNTMLYWTSGSGDIETFTLFTAN